METFFVLLGMWVAALLGFAASRNQPEMTILYYAIAVAVIYTIWGTIIYFIRKKFIRRTK